ATSNVENVSPQALRQVLRELTEMRQNPPEGIHLIFRDDDVTNIQADIEGPAGTPYEDGTFRVRLVLGKSYPATPPKGYFVTKIFHPNVSREGEICVNTLKKDWNKDLGLKHIFVTIKCLLIAPNAESALNMDAGRLLLEDYEDYARRARMMTEIHAPKSKTCSANTTSSTIDDKQQCPSTSSTAETLKRNEGQTLANRRLRRLFGNHRVALMNFSTMTQANEVPLIDSSKLESLEFNTMDELEVVGKLEQNHRYNCNKKCIGKPTTFKCLINRKLKTITITDSGIILAILLASAYLSDAYRLLQLPANVSAGNVIKDVRSHVSTFLNLSHQTLIDSNHTFGDHVRTVRADEKLTSGGFGRDRNQHQYYEQLCGEQLDYIMAQAPNSVFIGNSSDVQMFNYFDSFGRAKSSLIMGNFYWLGNYGQCLAARIRTHPGDNRGTTTRYCMANMLWPGLPKYEGFDYDHYHLIGSALCLPRSCDSLGAESHRDKIATLMRILIGEAPLVGSRLESIYCLPDSEAPFMKWTNNRATVNLVVLITTWIVIMIICTTVDLAHAQRRKLLHLHLSKSDTSMDDLLFLKIVSWFALNRALKSLFFFGPPEITSTNNKCANGHQSAAIKLTTQDSTDSSSAPSNLLAPLEGIKALSLLCIVAAHSWMFQSVIYAAGDFVSRHTAISRLLTIILPAISVNNFFAATGVITTYTLFMYVSKEKFHSLTDIKLWIGFVIQRYIRVVPLWFLAVWVMKTLPYMGSGPVWDYATSNVSSSYMCQQESWSSVWLKTANLLRGPSEHCVITGWYLATDMQFALVIAPIYTILLLKSPVSAYLSVLLFVAIGMAKKMYFMLTLGTDLRPMTKFDLHASSIWTTDLGTLYTSPVTRAPYHVLGLGIGHVFYMHQTNQSLYPSDEPAYKWRRNLCNLVGRVLSLYRFNWFCTMFIAITLPVVEIVGLLSSEFEILQSQEMSAFLVGITHYLYLFTIPAIIMPLLYQPKSHIIRFLGHHNWRFLTRIALSVLVVHPIVIKYYYTSVTHFIQAPIMMVFMTTLGLVVSSYIAGCVSYVLFEFPIRSISCDLVKAMTSAEKLKGENSDPEIEVAGMTRL
ncbi:Ubiquitin-conjugating enzyme E2 S, partial [Fragariocoptes setiger]